jgi:hypothetical protein
LLQVGEAAGEETGGAGEETGVARGHWAESLEGIGVFVSWSALAFYLEILIIGMGVGVVEQLLFLYVIGVKQEDGSIDGLGGNASLCGTMVLVTVRVILTLYSIPGKGMIYVCLVRVLRLDYDRPLD